MALTPEEQAELQQLEQEQSSLGSQYAELKQRMELENQPVQETPETGYIEALARGAAQGLTFETADEIAAALESGLTNKPYEQALKESRAEYKAAEEEYPITSAVGGLAGGIGQVAGIAALTGGTGAAAGAAQTGSKLAKLGGLARSAFLPAVGESAAKNIATAAGTGALMGGLTSIGASEKEGLGRLKEVPGGALTGGIVGGVLGGAIEGVKGAAGAIGGKLSKAADEGKLPFSFRKIRDLWRSGKEGQGYATESELRKIDEKFQNAAEEGVNLIQNNLDDVRNIKNAILEKVDSTTNVKIPINTLMTGLEKSKSENLVDADDAFKRVSGLYNAKIQSQINEAGDLSVKSANDLVGQLEDYLQSNSEISGEVKSLMRNAINDIKSDIRKSVRPDQIYDALKNNPEIFNSYIKFIKTTPELFLQEEEANRKFLKNFKAAVSRSKKSGTKFPNQQEVVQETVTPKKRGRPRKIATEQPTTQANPNFQNIIKEGYDVLKESSKSTPLAQLDSTMHNILNASESLGGITRGQGDSLKRKFKVFDVMRGTTSETGSGQKAFMRYEQAISDLEKANPDLAIKFKNITEPRIIELENKKFLEGGKLGEGSKESAAIKQFITGPVTQVVGQAANIAAQPAFSLPRLGVTGLTYMKRKVDDRLTKFPNSITYKTFSESLQRAIDAKDEGRRASIINILMQYKTFREMFKKEDSTVA